LINRLHHKKKKQNTMAYWPVLVPAITNIHTIEEQKRTALFID